MNFQDVLIFLLGVARNYGFLFIIFFWLIIVIYIWLKNKTPDYLYSQSYLNYILVFIPLIFFIMFIFNISINLTGSFSEKSFKIILTFITIVVFMCGIWYINKEQIITTDIAAQIMFFLNVIGIVILLIAIIICVRVFKDIAYSLEGWLGIGARVLFFIPCMISDLFSFTMGQFAKSPFVVYVLIAIEIALILTYIYLPKILVQFSPKSGYKLLSNPVLLRNETPISSFANVQTQAGDIPISVATTTNKYSLSMWFYVVKMPGNQYPYNGEGRIFELTNSHPKIVYNGPNNVCRVYYGPNLSTEFKITLQKWVHFVIVYDSTNIDIFINGKLVKSVPRIADSIISEPTDQILAGQEKGLQGGLSNIMYYHNAISKQQISVLYDLNKDVDPPIN